MYRTIELHFFSAKLKTSKPQLDFADSKKEKNTTIGLVEEWGIKSKALRNRVFLTYAHLFYPFY